MKSFFLGISLKITSSLCKMKSKATIGVKNTAHYTHSLYILLTVMEIFNTILFHNFVDKIQTILVDYLEGNLPIVDKIFYFSNGCAEWSMFNGQCSCWPGGSLKVEDGTRSSHHFVPIFCNKIADKLTSEDRQFLQFNFLTEEIDIKISSVFRMSAVSTIHFGGLA